MIGYTEYKFATLFPTLKYGEIFDRCDFGLDFGKYYDMPGHCQVYIAEGGLLTFTNRKPNLFAKNKIYCKKERWM